MTGRGTEAGVVSRRRRRRLDLVERHALPDRILHAVADDRHHVSIFDDVELIAQVAVPGHDVGPPSFDNNGTDGIASSTSRFRASISPWMPPPRATSIDRKPGHIEDVAGGDHIGSAEVHNRVTVGVSRLQMQDLDALAVEIHVFPLLVYVSVGHAAVGYGGVLPVGALIRDNTFSADRMAAAPPFVMPLPSWLLV